MVRLIVLFVLTIMVSGCGLIVPREGLQGGSNVAYMKRTWHDNGKLASECLVDRDGLSQYGAGVTVTVTDDCGVTFTAPEVTQGDATITADQVRRYSPAEIIEAVDALRELRDGG